MSEDFTIRQPGDITNTDGLFIVRLYDGMDNQWIDISGPLPYDQAFALWLKRTENGTKQISFGEIDYYRIFSADTQMLYTGGFGER